MLSLDDLDHPLIADYRLVALPDELRQRNLMVVEGRLLLPRLLDAPHVRTRSVLLTMAAWESLRDELEARAGDAPVYVIPQAHMNGLVGFNMHRGCLALAERPVVPALDRVDLGACRRVLILEGVNNPDNIGGLFRNAAAFDVDLVVLGPRCGDPFYRKAMRTSMGAVLGVPIAAAGDWPGAIALLRRRGLRVLALTPAPAALPLPAVEPRDAPLALLLGAEGEGLSEAAMQAADARVRIAINPGVDSLNVATAAAIALHHFAAGPGGR